MLNTKWRNGWLDRLRRARGLALFASLFAGALAAQPHPDRMNANDEEPPLPENGEFNPSASLYRPLLALRSLVVEDADFLSAVADRRWLRTRFSPDVYTREFHRGSTTRDFFRTEAPLDNYNAERVVFLDGPQTVLHHTGTPIGFPHQLSRRAISTRRFGNVSLRMDHLGAFRLTTDLNQPIPGNGMALRVLSLLQDGPGFRRPSVNERQGVSAHWEWGPNTHNAIRLAAEYGALHQVVPAPAVLYDWYTPWVEAGRPLADEPGQALGDVPGVEWVAGGDYLIHIENSELPVMNWRRMGRGSPPLVKGARETRMSFHPSDLPFDLSPYASLTGWANTLDQRYAALSGFWEYVFDGWLSTELGARLESGETERIEGLRGGDHALQVDVNRFLPDGTPNPFVGRPYIETTALSLKHDHRWTSLQARNSGTLQLQPEFRDATLGTLEVGWLFALWHMRSLSQWKNEVNLTPLGTSQNLNHPAQRIRRRHYIGFEDDAYPVFSSAFAPIRQDGIESAFMSVGNAPQRNDESILTWMVSLRSRLFNDQLGLTYGIGRDRARVNEGLFERDERGIWPNPRESEAEDTHTFEKMRRTFGVSYAPTESSMLHYNRAKSFLPPRSSQRDIFGERVRPQEVEGHEAGLAVALADGRLHANFTLFELTRFNQPSAALRGQKANWVYAIWEEIEPPRAADRIAWVDLLDTRGRGFEFDLVFQPNRSWRLAWNLAQDRRRVHEVMPRFASYLKEHLPLWEAHADVPVNSPRGENVGELTEAIVTDFELERAQIGSRLLRNREWQSQLSMSYRFARESPLNGWSLGHDLRWLGSAIIGFADRTADQPDLARPFYSRSQWNSNAWISHSRRIGKSLNWTLRVQVNNLFGERAPAELGAVDDGTGTPVFARLSTRPPRYLFLTNTLRF
ncbi:MAG: TonB-dependent receptor [Opitutales bacterium]|nr:TonB-dependent receptor [Opitutales bacterium]